jgi:hypothetical protein
MLVFMAQRPVTNVEALAAPLLGSASSPASTIETIAVHTRTSAAALGLKSSATPESISNRLRAALKKESPIFSLESSFVTLVSYLASLKAAVGVGLLFQLIWFLRLGTTVDRSPLGLFLLAATIITAILLACPATVPFYSDNLQDFLVHSYLAQPKNSKELKIKTTQESMSWLHFIPRRIVVYILAAGAGIGQMGMFSATQEMYRWGLTPLATNDLFGGLIGAANIPITVPNIDTLITDLSVEFMRRPGVVLRRLVPSYLAVLPNILGAGLLVTKYLGFDNSPQRVAWIIIFGTILSAGPIGQNIRACLQHQEQSTASKKQLIFCYTLATVVAAFSAIFPYITFISFAENIPAIPSTIFNYRNPCIQIIGALSSLLTLFFQVYTKGPSVVKQWLRLPGPEELNRWLKIVLRLFYTSPHPSLADQLHDFEIAIDALAPMGGQSLKKEFEEAEITFEVFARNFFGIKNIGDSERKKAIKKLGRAIITELTSYADDTSDRAYSSEISTDVMITYMLDRISRNFANARKFNEFFHFEQAIHSSTPTPRLTYFLNRASMETPIPGPSPSSAITLTSTTSALPFGLQEAFASSSSPPSQPHKLYNLSLHIQDALQAGQRNSAIERRLMGAHFYFGGIQAPLAVIATIEMITSAVAHGDRPCTLLFGLIQAVVGFTIATCLPWWRLQRTREAGTAIGLFHATNPTEAALRISFLEARMGTKLLLAIFVIFAALAQTALTLNPTWLFAQGSTGLLILAGLTGLHQMLPSITTTLQGGQIIPTFRMSDGMQRLKFIGLYLAATLLCIPYAYALGHIFTRLMGLTPVNDFFAATAIGHILTLAQTTSTTMGLQRLLTDCYDSQSLMHTDRYAYVRKLAKIFFAQNLATTLLAVLLALQNGFSIPAIVSFGLLMLLTTLAQTHSTENTETSTTEIFSTTTPLANSIAAQHESLLKLLDIYFLKASTHGFSTTSAGRKLKTEIQTAFRYFLASIAAQDIAENHSTSSAHEEELKLWKSVNTPESHFNRFISTIFNTEHWAHFVKHLLLKPSDYNSWIHGAYSALSSGTVGYSPTRRATPRVPATPAADAATFVASLPGDSPITTPSASTALDTITGGRPPAVGVTRAIGSRHSSPFSAPGTGDSAPPIISLPASLDSLGRASPPDLTALRTGSGSSGRSSASSALSVTPQLRPAPSSTAPSSSPGGGSVGTNVVAASPTNRPSAALSIVVVPPSFPGR